MREKVGIEMSKTQTHRTPGGYIIVDKREYFVVKTKGGRLAGTKAFTQEEAVERIESTLSERIAA